MRSKAVVLLALSCLIWAGVVQSHPQSKGKGQSQGPCGPPPSGPPPSGPPPSGMPPRGGPGGPCGPPPTGNPLSATTASARK